MEHFEQLVEQYTPMIHKIIHSLHLYRDQEEFYQTALIALWEADKGFNGQKGSFTNYAYTYIKGKLLHELTNHSTYEARYMHPKEEFWESLENHGGELPLEAEVLLSYCHGLTEKEALWLLATFRGDLSIKEIASQEKVSVSAVKQWKLGALKKLRQQLPS